MTIFRSKIANDCSLPLKKTALLFNELNDKNCSTVTEAAKLQPVFKQGHVEVQFTVYGWVKLKTSVKLASQVFN